MLPDGQTLVSVVINTMAGMGINTCGTDDKEGNLVEMLGPRRR
jgi:hypothetical protein